MTRGADEMNFHRPSRRSLTATKDLRIERLGIVFVEDMWGDVGGVVVNHCYLWRLGVGGEEGKEIKGSMGLGTGETRSQQLSVLYCKCDQRIGWMTHGNPGRPQSIPGI